MDNNILNQKNEELLQEFQVDKNIIEHLIHSQSADLDKAFIELIQNSIDSGSKNISIEVSALPSSSHDHQEEEEIYDEDWSFVLIDDGSGMITDEDFLTNLSVFGLKKDDRSETNQFGRFSMGRGQILRFGPVSWISGNKVFSVDLKGKGLGYHFSKKNELESSITNGCKVEGLIKNNSHGFYDFDQLKNRLKDNLKFISSEIKIMFNGEQLNVNSRKLVYHKSGLFSLYEYNEYELRTSSGGGDTLKIYNMGVFVTQINSFVQGHLIVHQHLQLNTSRDQILYNSCPVWKEIDVEIQQITRDRLQTVSEFTLKDIKALIQSIYNTRHSNFKVSIDILFDKPLFPVNNRINKKLTLRELSENSSQLVLLTSSQIQQSQSVKQIVDRIIQSLPESEVLIVKVDVFDSVDDFIYLLEDFLKDNYRTKIPTDPEELNQFKINRKSARSFFKKTRELTDFNHLLAGGDSIIEDSNIKDKNTLMTLHAFRKVYSLMRSELGHKYGWEKDEQGEWKRVVIERRYSQEFLFKRKLFLSSLPNNTLGNTDGATIIRIDADYFRSQITSISGLENIILLILHEMCHSKQFDTLDEHNLEFYQIYHNMTDFLKITEMVQKAAIQILRYHLKNNVPYEISQKIIESVKTQATNEKNLVDGIKKLNSSHRLKKKLKKLEKSKNVVLNNLSTLFKTESLQKHNGYAYYKEYYYFNEVKYLKDEFFLQISLSKLINPKGIYDPNSDEENKDSFEYGHQKILIATKEDLSKQDPKRPWRTPVNKIYGHLFYITYPFQDNLKLNFLIICDIEKKSHLVFLWANENEFNEEMQVFNKQFKLSEGIQEY